MSIEKIDLFDITKHAYGSEDGEMLPPTGLEH
jgi:hypothetical protein